MPADEGVVAEEASPERGPVPEPGSPRSPVSSLVCCWRKVAQGAAARRAWHWQSSAPVRVMHVCSHCFFFFFLRARHQIGLMFGARSGRGRHRCITNPTPSPTGQQLPATHRMETLELWSLWNVSLQGNDYEKARAEQIRRNLQRMEELNVVGAAAKVRLRV